MSAILMVGLGELHGRGLAVLAYEIKIYFVGFLVRYTKFAPMKISRYTVLTCRSHPYKASLPA